MAGMTTGKQSRSTRGISDCLVFCALVTACSRDAEVDVAPSAETSPPENDAKLRLDDEEHAIKSAIRVRRGELTEEWIVSSDEAGCELARDKVAGKSQPRLRLAWTMATDFETGKSGAINPWWLFVSARGGVSHGSIDGATMEMDVPAHDKRRAKLTLAPTRWQRYTVSAAGFVTFRECSPETAAIRAIDTLSVEIGKVPIAIRSVNLLLNEQGTRALLFSTMPRACNDFEEGELLLMTSTLGEEPLNLTLIGRALPYRHDSLPLQGDAAFEIRHRDIAAGDRQVDVSVSGKAKLNSKGGHYKDLAVSVQGRAAARICREADLKAKK
jgi:hypothetical protein